jgi:hypothetical protein
MTSRLTETQDRLLAMADDEWADLATAKAVLESWFAVRFSVAELQAHLAVLVNERLVSCTIKSQPCGVVPPTLPEELAFVEFKATGAGVRYLSQHDGGHAV